MINPFAVMELYGIICFINIITVKAEGR
jgi:hypothetical protein